MTHGKDKDKLPNEMAKIYLINEIMATVTSLAPHMPSRRIASLDFSRSESGSAIVKYSHRTVTTAL